MIIKPAKRTQSIQEYYFSRKLKEIAKMPGVINLGIGAPDRMPPKQAIEELQSCSAKEGVHAYQSYVGTPELRNAFALWYERYYNVNLDPDTQIQPLFGSKEGILLISMAFVDEGDKVLVPDPGYPTYTSASKLVGAEIINYSLKEELGWQPDFEELEKMDLDGVKIMWTNYPNMPTGGKATPELYKKLVDFALKHNILIVNDNPYSFILNDNPISILEQPRSMECCLELNSLSKAHNMSGWRVGMLAGESELIKEVLKVKSQMDSGMFRPMQMAAIKALEQGPDWFIELNNEYKKRKIVAKELFDIIGAKYDTESSGLFLWGKIEADNPMVSINEKSLGEQVSDFLLYKAGVFITPGFIFGKNGQNYVRVSLCANEKVLSEAVTRIKKVLKI